MRRRALVAGGAGVALVIGLGWYSIDEPAPSPPARPSPVALSAKTLATPVEIGMIVSVDSPAGEGSQWRGDAEGAQVAAYRFGLGGTKVTVRAVNDGGTPEGARQAVDRLVQARVSAIVAGTSGTHLRPALDAARRARTAVLLPYEDHARGLPDNVWLTGPSRAQADRGVVAATRAVESRRPFVISAGERRISGLEPARRHTITIPDEAADAAAQVKAAATGRTPVDGVVVAGPPATQAAVVKAVRAATPALPLVLTPEALSSTFPAQVGTDGDALAGQLVTTGTDAADPAAMSRGERGRGMSAFLAGLRLAAADPARRDFFAERPFRAYAGAADSRSHDAVVAAVRAAAAAGSTAPERVLGVLAGGQLALSSKDGIAGAPLRFSDHEAVADDAVVTLAGTTQDPNLRLGADGRPALVWFSTEPEAAPSGPAASSAPGRGGPG